MDAPLPQVFDGIGGTTEFDIVLTNQSAYEPWESNKNGPQISNGVSSAFVGVSMAAKTEVDFHINFYYPTTTDPFVINEGARNHMPTHGPP